MRRFVNWVRRVRGYCLVCENKREQDDVYCDLHLLREFQGEEVSYLEFMRRSRDMRVTPVDNPMHLREDGSIRKGDPAWGMFEEMIKDGRPVIANQRPDGTWEVKKL